MNKKLFIYAAAALVLGTSSAHTYKSYPASRYNLQYAREQHVRVIPVTVTQTPPQPVRQTPHVATVNKPAIIAQPVQQPVVASPVTPSMWYRLGSGMWNITKWTTGLPIKIPTVLLTQFFKLPGLNLMFGEKTAQVVAALAILATCVYNPAVLTGVTAQAVTAIKCMTAVFSACNITECICKILLSLHNNHPYMLWGFALPAIILLGVVLFVNTLSIRTIAIDNIDHGISKTKILLNQTIAQLPSYITQPAQCAYQKMWELLGYPMEELAMVENCTKIMPWQTPAQCVELVTQKNLTLSSTCPSQTYLLNSLRQHVSATTNVIKKGATSTWNYLKETGKGLYQWTKSTWNRQRVAVLPAMDRVAACATTAPTSQCVDALTTYRYQ